MKGLLRRNGQVVKVVEAYCPRCKVRVICTEAEAQLPAAGVHPFCTPCLEKGNPVIMQFRSFRSGPTELFV